MQLASTSNVNGPSINNRGPYVGDKRPTGDSSLPDRQACSEVFSYMFISFRGVQQPVAHVSISGAYAFFDSGTLEVVITVVSIVEPCSEYELPIGDMLGAIVYEAGSETEMDYDIVPEQRSGYPQHVNRLHPSNMSLQFPLLFIYGEDGYSKNLKLTGGVGSSTAEKRISMKAYYAYYLHGCENR
ncbi:hypothetical protein Tco_1303026 [Tanacetum coccineum]